MTIERVRTAWPQARDVHYFALSGVDVVSGVTGVTCHEQGDSA
jgi:hypothetical protein